MRLTPVLPTALVGALLVLTGCAGATSPDVSPSDESPLSEYFSAIYGGDLSQEEQEKKYAADEKAREELVSQCMTDQGFEYVPAVSNVSFASDADAWKPDDREWVSQYGYGMVDYPGMNDPGSTEEYVDPNADYVESLSTSEQNAFYEALNGPQPSEEELSEDGSFEYDWKTAGCYGSAQHELEGEDPTQSEEHKPVMDALNTFYTDIENAPEIADLDAEWAACMSEAGYPGLNKQFDAQNALNDELNKFYETQTGAEGPDEAAMDEFGEKEIETALADLDCREQTEYRQKHAEAQNTLEQQFIDDHQAELDALKADAEQGN